MFESLFISSLVRVQPGFSPCPVASVSALRGETVSVQLAYRSGVRLADPLEFSCSGPLAPFARVRRVRPVYAEFLGDAQALPDALQRGYELTGPGMVPDVLDPDLSLLHATPNMWHALWIDLVIPPEFASGDTVFECVCRTPDSAPARLTVHVCESVLPAQTLRHTEWFHCDGLFREYHADFDDPAFYPVLEAYFRDFTAHGMNMLLTPLFTPPLDTQVGGERRTTQLLRIRRTADGWSFDFSLLERWITLARACGVRYFEFPHFFTQWGAKATPKIVAEVDGESRRVFGWHVASDAPEYREFLDALLPALKAFLVRLNLLDCCYFHISDEPYDQTLEQYRMASGLVKQHLQGVRVMDALSHPDFFRQGLVSIPVPAEDSFTRFQDLAVPERWVYYCMHPELPYPNRLLSMPLTACRVLGTLLYRNRCTGFLHWGYNCWNSACSRHDCDLLSVEPGFDFPAGDPCLVYPGPHGPLDSIRMEVQFHGLQDQRALQLLELRAGRAFVLDLIREAAGNTEVEFDSFPLSADFLPRLRERVNRELDLRLTR